MAKQRRRDMVRQEPDGDGWFGNAGEARMGDARTGEDWHSNAGESIMKVKGGATA